MAIPHRTQLCSNRYTTLQTKNSMRSTSTINPVATEIAIKRTPQLSITEPFRGSTSAINSATSETMEDSRDGHLH